MYTAPSRLKNRNSALASPEKWKNMPAIPTKDAKRPKVSKTVPDLNSGMRKVCSKDIDNKTVQPPLPQLLQAGLQGRSWLLACSVEMALIPAGIISGKAACDERSEEAATTSVKAPEAT
jgi:hypothetical protein